MPLAIACATLAVLGALSLAFVRAEMFVVPLFVAVIWLCLDDYEQNRLRPRVMLVVAVLALWANLHGSVLIGAALAAAYFSVRAVLMARGKRARATGGYVLLAIAAALAPLATPFGIHVLAYYHQMIGNQAVKLADIEWDSPTFPALSFFQFALPLLLAALAVIPGLVKGRRPPWPLLGALVVTAIAAWIAMRNNMWLAIAASILIAEAAANWLPSNKIRASFILTLSLSAIALMAFGIGRLATRSASGFEAQAPLGAIAATASYVASHPDARVLADTMSASALLWLDPAITGHVGFDGELEIYPQPALIAWITFQNAHSADWLAAANGYRILVATRSDDSPLAQRLTRLPRSTLLATDAQGVAVIAAARTTRPRCQPRKGARQVACGQTAAQQ